MTRSLIPGRETAAIGELCLHPGASQLLIEPQEVGPLAYTVTVYHYQTQTQRLIVPSSVPRHRCTARAQARND